jgi:hypothetical protein
MEKLKTKVNKFIKLRNELKNYKGKIFEENECPLLEDHYELSEAIFGVGCWQWTCGFCGKVETE